MIIGDIKCHICKKTFKGWYDKEDTCKDCLKEVLK